MEICDEGIQLAHVGKVGHEIPNLQMVIKFPHCFRDDKDEEDDEDCCLENYMFKAKLIWAVFG